MKKLFVMLIAALMIVSSWDNGIVLAELNSFTIKGAKTVQAGQVYEYSITVLVTGFNFVSLVTSGGAFEAASVECFKDGSSNGSLSSTVKLSVTVKADALPGDKGTFHIMGQGSSVDENYNVTEFDFSQTLSVTVATTPEVTQKPPSNNKPTATPTPTPTPEPSGWELAVLQIESMPQGGTLTMSMSDPLMTSAALALLQDKKGTLILDFGSYSCTIDGSALGDVANTPIDLGMTMTKDEVLSANADGKDIYQLHFAHSGDLPGTFLFTYKATENQPGDTVFLYFYYDSSRVVEGVQSSTVDADGYVTFGIYHCSSYFVSAEIMEGAAGLLVMSTLDPATVSDPPLPSTSSKDTLVIGVGALIAVVFGTAILCVFTTMFVFRVGMFRKQTSASPEAKEKEEEIQTPPEE